MLTVDLVYDLDCPNIEAARANLRRAFANLGQPPGWREHRIGSAALPAYARGYGSPTILVDGRDVAGSEPGSDACCRLYAGSEGTSGAPAVEQIAAALERAARAARG
jgi:hypothetical protein